MKEVMLTLIGPDAKGIVARMAEVVEANGGNWLDSRMIRMGGYFSGILRIALPEEDISSFGGQVFRFMKEVGYQYSIQPAELESPAEGGGSAQLKLSGQDHPGIVHAIFAAFQKSGANVEELSTGLKAAPWSGTPVFEADARLHIPEGVSIDQLQQNLEALAADLMVEVELN
ncbi:MAG: glycine cleavage system protein R [Opitutales bacterium]|jgi:glycine cleavage system regulatory protein